MSNLIAKEPENKEFEPTPEGVYVARCYRIVDLGTQPNSFNGEEVKPRHRVVIFWELLDDEVKMDNGEPFTVRREYTLSLDKKATLRADLQAWRGKAFTEDELLGFDLENILGTYCRLQIVHAENNGKTYANISSIMAMKNSEPKPSATRDIAFFDLSDPDMKLFEQLPEYLKEKIQSAPEWQQAPDKAATPIDLSEIPFD